MLRKFSLTDIEKDIWIFAMYYDFMSYVAQKLCSFHDKEKTLQEGRIRLTEAVAECSRKFIHSNEALFSGMNALVNES